MIRCVAIDDEPLALAQLGAYLCKVPFLELAGSCMSALEAIEVMRGQEIDAIFIDINMPDLNGLDFVRSLQRPPLTVITTAYQEYAIEGYKVDAIDYLLKPFGMADVLRAAEKVRQRYQLLHTADTAPDEDDSLYLKTEYRMVHIRISHIIYIEGMAEYLRIYTTDQPKPVVALLSMKRMEEQLSGRGFMRIHKSHIISLSHIAAASKSHVTLDNGRELPIGDSYHAPLADYIGRKLLGR